MKYPIYLFDLFNGCIFESNNVPKIIFSYFSWQHIDSINIFSIPSKNIIKFLKLITNGKLKSASVK